MIKLGPGILILFPFPYTFTSICIPITISLVLFHMMHETLILTFLKLVPTQVSFFFVSKPRQQCWLWEIFIGCHLDKYKNLIEYSLQLSVETKRRVAMDTGWLASAPTHQSLFSSTMCTPQMLVCIVFTISLDLLAKEYLGLALAVKEGKLKSLDPPLCLQV